MRRLSYILFLCVLVACAAGCSGNADPDIPVHEEDAWIHDINLPVPVEFVIPSTKAVKDDLNDLTSGSTFGLFAVDKNSDNLSESNGLDIFNSLCYFKPGDPAGLTFGNAGENRKVYYPSKSDVNYTFYAYHQRTSKTYVQDDGSVIYYDGDDVQTLEDASNSSRNIMVNIPLATQNDVIYGVAEAPVVSGLDGFNADYIRSTGNIPTFSFSHPAAGVGLRVRFDESSSQMTDYQVLNLLHIRFKNVATRAALCIVDKNVPSRNGTFVEAIERKDTVWIKKNTANVNLKFFEDMEYGDGEPPEYRNTEPAYVGDEHFIMPSDEVLEMEAVVEYRVWAHNKQGALVTNDRRLLTVPFVLDPDPYGTGQGFKAGYMYRYLLTFNYDSSKAKDERVSVVAEPDVN